MRLRACGAWGGVMSRAGPSPPMREPALIRRLPWGGLLGGLVLAAAALVVDQHVTNWLTDPTVRQRVYLVFGVPAAASVFVTPLAVLVSLPNAQRRCVGYVAALLVSTVVTHVLKWVVGRARPYTGLGALHFEPLSWKDDLATFALHGRFESFPSGHSSAAAALAVLLGIYFPRARWVFYFFAGLVGLERIVHNRHFLSDVLAGLLIGAASVYVCLKLLGPGYYAQRWPAHEAERP